MRDFIRFMFLVGTLIIVVSLGKLYVDVQHLQIMNRDYLYEIDSLSASLLEQDTILSDLRDLRTDKENEITSLKDTITKINAENSKLKAKLEKTYIAQTKVATAKAETKKTIPVVSRGKDEGSGMWTSGWQATYYNLSVESTGKTSGHPAYGVTASGRKVQDGVTIAVDRRIIPLGTWVLIKFPDGKIIKRRADDTGGAISGKVIDIFDSRPNSTLRQLGRERNLQVKVLR
jgi:3D (Asp-Asp-Asp) domain-containing protein